jgi:NhaP-type Na+/H+ and K+/H+ antiporter
MSSVIHMKSIWLCFAVSIAAAWSFSAFAWMFTWYISGMIAFLLVTVGIAVLVLTKAIQKKGALAIVIVGLVAGNWALLQVVVMTMIWSLRGFAP